MAAGALAAALAGYVYEKRDIPSCSGMPVALASFLSAVTGGVGANRAVDHRGPLSILAIFAFS